MFVMLSLMGVRGFTMIDKYADEFTGSRPINRDNLIISPVIVETLDVISEGGKRSEQSPEPPSSVCRCRLASLRLPFFDALRPHGELFDKSFAVCLEVVS